ncbi:FG-GAP-like repeat-containing protein [Archangium gephyra]|uniref:FG-GAP-like repeat-containing protein n=1 Tax=Archangium gephyra TaxID=48 RepID=UPI0035D4B434
MIRPFRFLLTAALVWVAACSSPFSTESSEPESSSSPLQSSTFNPLPQGFDWSMEERFPVDLDGDGVRDYRDLNADGQRNIDDLYGYLNPQSFMVTLDGCPTTDPGYTYQWFVKRSAGDSWRVTYLDQGCRFTSSFPGQGAYEVTLTIRESSGESRQYVQQVVVKDWVIVALGDSYGSGEGNPDVPRSGGQPARWADQRCHRSFKAGTALAAQQLEEQDRRTSVTYVSLACSGATISRATYNQGPLSTFKEEGSYLGSGILFDYIGIERPSPVDGPWPTDQFLKPQVQQLASIAGQRRIDALVISAGGNDMGFGDVLKHCVATTNCHIHADGDHLSSGVSTLRAAMQTRYAALGDRIASSLNVSNVYLTEYPDFSRDANGETCSSILKEVGDNTDIFSGIAVDGIVRHQGELGWIQQNFLKPLSDEMTAAVTSQRTAGRPWHYVGGIQEASKTHGLCAGANRWFRTATDAVAVQGPNDTAKTTGTAHPNEEGHRAYARFIRASLAKTLGAHPYYPDGTLLRDPSGTIHVVQGFGRFVIPNEAELNTLLASLGKSTADIQNISAQQLADIPTTPREATFLREPDGTIAVVHGGAAFPIASLEDLGRIQAELGMSPSEVGPVPSGTLASLRPLPRDGTVLRDASGAIVYMYQGARRDVLDMVELNELGVLGGQVNPLPWGLLGSLPAWPSAGANAPLRLSPLDATFWRDPDGTIAVTYGGAAFPIPSLSELNALAAATGRTDVPVHDLPAGALYSLPRLPSDNQLLREPNGSISIVQGGTAFWISSMEELENVRAHLPSEMRGVKDVPSNSFARLRSTPLNRTLLREWNHPAVYVILGSAKYHMQSEDDIREIGLDMANIRIVPAGALSRFPTGDVRLAGDVNALSPSGQLSGWGLDLDSASNAMEIHFYIDGDANSDRFVGKAWTTLPRPDVNNTYRDRQAAGMPGFTFSIPYAYHDGQQHTVYVYAADVQRRQHLLLGTRTFRLSGDYNNRLFMMDVAGDMKDAFVERSASGAFKFTRMSAPAAVGLTQTEFSDANGWTDPNRFFVMDYDGDGNSDLVARDAQGTLHGLRSDGTKLIPVGIIGMTGYSDAAGWLTGNRFYAMDYDRDGDEDLVLRNAAGGFEAIRSDRTSLTPAGALSPTYSHLSDGQGWNTANRFFVMDYDGDLRDDLVGRDAGGNIVGLHSTGTQLEWVGVIAGTGYSDVAGWGSGNRFYAMDYDGDGDDDLVTRNSWGGFAVLRSERTHMTYHEIASTSLSDAQGWNGPNRFFVMDYDGDGKQDLVGRDAGGYLAGLRSDGSQLSWVGVIAQTSFPDSNM